MVKTRLMIMSILWATEADSVLAAGALSPLSATIQHSVVCRASHQHQHQLVNTGQTASKASME